MLRGLLCVGKVCYPELEHCTSAGRAVARASLRAEAQRVGATTVAAPLRSSLALVARLLAGLPPDSARAIELLLQCSRRILPRWFAF